MDTARYVIGVLIVTFLPPGLIWWFAVHPFVAFWRKFGPRTTLTVMAVLSIGGVVALMTVRDTLLGRDLGTSWGLVALGAVLIVISFRIALARRPHLNKRILAGVPELDADPGSQTLLTEGIYARIRHPRYIEVGVGTLGYACFANHVGAWLVAMLTLPTLHLIVLIEERELATRFGAEWEAYRARVPRYLPRG